MDNRDQRIRVNVRRGTPEDSDLLVELVCALADYEKLPRPEPDARARLVCDAFGPASRFDTWFGEWDGKAVGYAITFYTYSTFLAMPTLYLEDLFVLSPYRSHSVGKALFIHCARMAWEQGCGRMEWQVLQWNETALGFYEHIGAARQADWLPFRATRGELARIIGQ